MISNWKTCQLGELVTFTSGGTPSKKKAEYWNGSIPWISAKTMKDEHISTSDLMISEEGLKNGSRLAPQGSILFLIRGSGLFNGIPICLVDKPVAFNQDVKCINSISEIENKYVFYWLLSQASTLSAIVGVTTIGAGKFDMDVIKRLEISYPEKEVRNEIIRIADAISDKIRLNTAINENLEQQAQALFKAWFVDFEPFGGVMPDDWIECILDSMCSLIIKGITPKYNEHSAQLVINQKCVRNHQIDLSLARCHEPKKVNEKWLQYGDIVVNSTGTGTLGRAAQVLFTPNNMTVDSHVTIIRASKQEYIYYLGLWATSHEHDFEMLQTGSTGQTDLPRERLKQMQIVLPSDSILSSFSKVIKPIADIRIQKQQENQRLSALRDTLLPKLMNGEIDVSAVQV
mgnify:CR=1 FL=1